MSKSPTVLPVEDLSIVADCDCAGSEVWIVTATSVEAYELRTVDLVTIRDVVVPVDIRLWLCHSKQLLKCLCVAVTTSLALVSTDQAIVSRHHRVVRAHYIHFVGTLLQRCLDAVEVSV